MYYQHCSVGLEYMFLLFYKTPRFCHEVDKLLTVVRYKHFRCDPAEASVNHSNRKNLDS